MELSLSYFRRSRVDRGAVTLSPNLRRSVVSFDAALAKPLRFREAVSALHDVVVSDLRWKPRDKTQYQEWLAEQKREESRTRSGAYQEAVATLAGISGRPRDPQLAVRFETCRKQYWDARLRYSDWLAKADPALWRQLVPCDPVVTVSPDVVFFECFSADESSYGCLTVDRDGGFLGGDSIQCGTTNVDYSQELFDHFQTLRTYRETRFQVDPAGFSVRTEGGGDLREEKIDLPESWLRGFLQLQAAMGIRARQVTLTREAVYSILAWSKRHRAWKSPRAIRFELTPGKHVEVVLEPWERKIVSHAPFEGERAETIRIWGRQRLLSLARLLPLAESFEVHLLGTGLPSFWVARMGELRFTLGLSGWTTNDWARASLIDLLMPAPQVDDEAVRRVGAALQLRQAASEADLARTEGLSAAGARAALQRLARTGQSIYDLGARVHRFRQVMPPDFPIAQFATENEESSASRDLRVKVAECETTPRGNRIATGNAGGMTVEAMIDSDGIIRKGKCSCSHHHRYGIRKGPCRHLLALRRGVLER